ncbi:hypothetical protein K488DRAFT_68437 [Vararia minispora EC-137]|uniref:Uncharacterized protein n=1 Tax=Vararia minispora EC-137 TaxID=1314806 RepID=A0ACB8QU66_9AGAM|nr:hypothetical protein K488DRAFT_68437 [Vararia minispora EC-137]
MDLSKKVEVIDLTNDYGSDVEEIPAPPARRLKEKDAKREPKKRNTSTGLEEGEILSSERTSRRASEDCLSRESSGEISKKRKKKRTKSAPSTRNSPHLPEQHPTLEPPPVDDKLLFFVDTAPAQVAEDQAFQEPPQISMSASTSSATASSPSPQTPPPSLLLPAHVSLVTPDKLPSDGAPIEIIRPPTPNSDSEAGSYIEYLDYDDNAAAGLRYFDERSEEAKKTRTVCKKCGAEGEHTTRDCPVLIECPSHWRIYEYVSESERQAILNARDNLQQIPLGEGGEGYVARDEWCYNCGGAGHLGDDCQEVSHVSDIPKDPSAFSAYNTMSGPFSDTTFTSDACPRGPREWEEGGEVLDSWGFKAPTNVGQQGRSKDRKRMAERARRADEEGEEEDWFNNPSRSIRIKGMANSASSPRPRSPSNAPRSIKFATARVDARGHLPSGPRKPTLADRLDDAPGRRDQLDRRRGSFTSSSRGYDQSNGSQKRHPSTGSRKRDNDDKRWEARSEREWDRGKSGGRAHSRFDRDYSGARDDRPRPGPRYHGGYAP